MKSGMGTLLKACGKGNAKACDLARRVHVMYAASEFTFASLPDPKQDKNHPNKLPFEGVLLLVDVASTKPPHGSQGHRIYVPRSVAIRKLPGIIGMGINYDKEDMNSHVTRHKVGVITKAWIDGNKVKVSGFVYKKDFPEAVHDLKQGDLGMSMELADVYVRDEKEDVWHLTDFIFTGATILKKDAAAYYQTALAAEAAAASGEREQMAKDPKKKKTVAAAGSNSGGFDPLAFQAAMTNALTPLVSRMEEGQREIRAGLEELKGLHVIAAAASDNSDDEVNDDEVVLHAAHEDDEDDDDEMEAAHHEDDEDDDDEMEAARQQQDDEDDDDEEEDGEDDASASDVDAMEDLEEDAPDEEPGELNKDSKNKGKKTSVTKPPKQGEHFPGSIGSKKLHSRGMKGKGMKKPFSGMKSSASIEAAAVQIGDLKAQVGHLRRQLKAQAVEANTVVKKLRTQVKTMKAQVERFAEQESRRSVMPVELTNLASKAGVDLQGLQREGRKLSVQAADEMFFAAQQRGILLDPETRIGMKMLMEQYGVLDQGTVPNALQRMQ